MNNGKNGFTLIEIVVVFGFLATLTGIVLAASINFRSSADINTTAGNLVTDIREQQTKAMTGDTEGSLITKPFGIYFSQTKYTLFSGGSYSSSDPSNFDINMKSGIQIQSTLPDNTIVFSQGSGETDSFSLGSDTITVNDTINNFSRTIKINRMGTVIEFN